MIYLTITLPYIALYLASIVYAFVCLCYLSAKYDEGSPAETKKVILGSLLWPILLMMLAAIFTVQLFAEIPDKIREKIKESVHEAQFKKKYK